MAADRTPDRIVYNSDHGFLAPIFASSMAEVSSFKYHEGGKKGTKQHKPTMIKQRLMLQAMQKKQRNLAFAPKVIKKALKAHVTSQRKKLTSDFATKSLNTNQR